MQSGVDRFDERRARRQREQLRQEVAERVVDGDRAIGACDADVDVQAERVVAPDDVAQQLVVASVVRRVDDALVLPAAPWMRGGAAEPDPQLARRPNEAARAALPSRQPRRRSSRSDLSAPRSRMRSARPRRSAPGRSRSPRRTTPRSGRSTRASRDRAARTPPRPRASGRSRRRTPRATARPAPATRCVVRRPPAGA